MFGMLLVYVTSLLLHRHLHVHDIKQQFTFNSLLHTAFRALLQIQAIHRGEPLPTDDEITNNPRVSLHVCLHMCE